ncbi:hypothetical protein ACFP6A_05815 [Quadrisphaera sp. GCM10027208]|uniref:hypothetical protein n=1 Tax=Quadrisphaera sp. GCM10027208 TaxID=3273423 RepID=UPI003622656E
MNGMDASPSPVDRDDVRDDARPLELPGLPQTNRYAVPLSVLLGGAYVSVTDTVEVHPEPPVCIAQPFTVPLGADGAGE